MHAMDCDAFADPPQKDRIQNRVSCEDSLRVASGAIASIWNARVTHRSASARPVSVSVRLFDVLSSLKHCTLTKS
jgi:hypothetical protein